MSTLHSNEKDDYFSDYLRSMVILYSRMYWTNGKEERGVELFYQKGSVKMNGKSEGLLDKKIW